MPFATGTSNCGHAVSGRRARHFESHSLLSQDFGHLGRRLIAVGRILGMEPGDDRAKPVGYVWVDFENGPGRVIANAAQDCQVAFARKRRLSGTQDIQHAAQTEQVAAVIDGTAAGLFWSTVKGGAHENARIGQARIIRRGPGQTEIQDFQPPAPSLQPDVRRLDVAMDQAARVRRRQALGNLLPDAQHLGNWQPSFSFQALLQGFPLEKLHGHEQHSAVFIHPVNGNQVIVLDRRGRPGLAEKALASGSASRQRGTQRFDGDQAVQLRVFRLKHDAHAAHTQHLQDPEWTESADLVRLLRGCEEVISLRRRQRRSRRGGATH